MRGCEGLWGVVGVVWRYMESVEMCSGVVRSCPEMSGVLRSFAENHGKVWETMGKVRKSVEECGNMLWSCKELCGVV